MSNATSNNQNRNTEVEHITLESLTEGSHKGYDLKRFIGKWNKDHEIGESAESDAIKLALDTYVDKDKADRPLGNNTYYIPVFETGALGIVTLKFKRDLEKSPRTNTGDNQNNRAASNDRPRNNRRTGNNRNGNKNRSVKK